MMISWNVRPVIVPPVILGVITPTGVVSGRLCTARCDALTSEARQTSTPAFQAYGDTILRQLVPTDSRRDISANDAYADLELPEGQDGRPYVVLNMVSTVDGKVALNGSAGGIGSRTDRR